jgi:sphingosine kinase
MIDPAPKCFKIIINPKSGKGKAEAIFKREVQPILQAAGCNVVSVIPQDQTNYCDVVLTTREKHAIEIAMNIPEDDYDGILCVGGDGIVHEVINGLAKKDDAKGAFRKLAIGVIPAGKYHT